MEFKSKFLITLSERGFLNQCTNFEGLDDYLTECEQKGEPASAYIGFDCTGPSLHVGSLVMIMILRHFQKAGHRPIVLMGGATTRIGDPSGKDEARQLLSDETIEGYKQSILKAFKNFLNFESTPQQAIMVDNKEWLDGKTYIDFLRDVGRYFTVNRMLTFDSVKLRLEREQPLTYLEFSYMLLQSFDFTELYKLHKCRLQMGGSDQWGNIISGADLGKRYHLPELFGLTTSLITTKSGAKMGKTAQGAVWLNPDMLSDYDYWQFWRNTEDGDVIRFMKMFTEIPMDEIKSFENIEGKAINDLKIRLANEATAMCRGREAAERARELARQTFELGTINESMKEYDVTQGQLDAGFSLIDALIALGLAGTRGEARRLIEGRGARINDVIVADVNKKITDSDFDNARAKISAGQKRHGALVKIETTKSVEDSKPRSLARG